MSATPYSVVQQGPSISGLFCVVTSSVSTNGIINLSAVFTSINLVLAGRQDNQTQITTSIAGNIITITQGGMTNIPVVILVFGVR